MTSIFTEMINREIPAAIVWEDDKFLAFLSNRPTAPGHTLLIPKKETDYIFDLPIEEYRELMETAYKLTPGIARAMKPIRMGISVVGFEIPHVHVHLIPMNTALDMDFHSAKWAELEDLEKIADKIRPELKNV